MNNEPKPQDLNKRTVIIAEDSRFLRKATELILSKSGFTVLCAQDGRETLDMAFEHQPDAIVLDLMMPKVNGIEVIRALKANPGTSSIPIVVLSALAQENDRKIIREGAAAYYEKSRLIPELLADIVKEAIADADKKERNTATRSYPGPDDARETLRASSVNHREYEQQLFEKLIDLNNELMLAQRKLAEANEELERRAAKDELTGLANRRKVAEEFEKLSALASRQKKHIALALLDIDNFKSINDRFGHPTGDRVLKSMGDLLSNSFRVEDIVGRWGGEEFIIVLYDCSKDEAMRRLDSLRTSFSRQNFGFDHSVTFSAGIASYPGDGAVFGQLCRSADTALYAAKREGRNRVLLSEAEMSTT